MTNNDKYNKFYNMVVRSSLLDYYTQGIKAEVIFDMLLLEFVEEIVSKATGENVVMLAQEFPIIREEIKKSGSNRNSKVDYLLGSSNSIYLVELKTTDESFKNIQFDIYDEAIKKSESLFINFKDIVTSNLGGRQKEKDKSFYCYISYKLENNFKKWKDYIIDKNSKHKYMASAVSIINGIRKINYGDFNYDRGTYDEDMGKNNELDERIDEEFVENYFKKLNGKLKIVYITPSGIPKEFLEERISETNSNMIVNIKLKPDKNNEQNNQKTHYIGDLINTEKAEAKLVLEILEAIYGRKED